MPEGGLFGHAIHTGRCRLPGRMAHGAWRSFSHRDEVGEEVEVATDKDQSVKLLSLEGDATTGLCGIDLEEEDDEGQQVQHVRRQPAMRGE